MPAARMISAASGETSRTSGGSSCSTEDVAAMSAVNAKARWLPATAWSSRVPAAGPQCSKNTEAMS